MPIIAVLIYIAVGAITHWLFIGSSIDWSSIGSFLTIFGWPLVYGAVVLVIALFLLLIGASIHLFYAIVDWFHFRKIRR